MNTATLDRTAYRTWWEAGGRNDLGTCPCLAPSGNPTGLPENLFRARPGFCTRHGGMLADREQFAAFILDGTFVERDLTEAQWQKAQRVILGLSVIDGGRQHDKQPSKP
jgi:hypothetical protein